MSSNLPEPSSGPHEGSAPEPHPGGSPHGRLRSWLLVAVVLAAFLAGGVALIAHLWWLFWVCVGIVVLSAPAGRLIGIMNDTVGWHGTGPLVPATGLHHAVPAQAAPRQPRPLTPRVRSRPCPPTCS